jgi:hypothetical protein
MQGSFDDTDTWIDDFVYLVVHLTPLLAIALGVLVLLLSPADLPENIARSRHEMAQMLIVGGLGGFTPSALGRKGRSSE